MDEIGNTTPEFQQNVLRAIEYQEIQRVGGASPTSVDVRIIAATNADLEREIAEGRFRRDLYDRLRFEVIRIPPLRERREDIQPLAVFFVEQIVREVPGLTVRPFSDGALRHLQGYPWPGNVRELKFAVERAACMATGPSIEPPDLPPEITSGDPAPPGEGFDAQGQVLRARIAQERAVQYELEPAQGSRIAQSELRPVPPLLPEVSPE